MQSSGASGNVEDSSTNAGNSSTAFSDNSADGTEFVLDNEKDIESQSARVTNQKEGQRSAKDSMSDIRLTQVDTTVKNNVSEEGEDYPIPATSNPEELLEAYENGEISRQEYLNALTKEKNLNPKEIADLTEEDANTTPKFKKKQGELDGEYVYSFSAEKQRESNTPRTLHAVVNDGNNPDANVKLSNNKVTQVDTIVKNKYLMIPKTVNG